MSQGCFQILSLVFKLVNFIFQLIFSPLLCPFSLKTLEAPEKHLNCGKKKINLMIRWSAAFQQCYDELAIHNTLHTWYVLIIIELRKSPTYNFHSLYIYLLSDFFSLFFPTATLSGQRLILLLLLLLIFRNILNDPIYEGEGNKNKI